MTLPYWMDKLMTTPTTVLMIAGSPTTPSRTAALLDYAAARARRAFPTVTIDVLQVRDLDPAELLHGRYDGLTVGAAAAQVAAATAIVVATPVYKAAYTGTLKTFLDVLPTGAFVGKIVLPIAVGGSMAHSLVLDYALRPVCAALGSPCILPGLYLIDKELIMSDGSLSGFATPEIESRVHVAFDRLVNDSYNLLDI